MRFGAVELLEGEDGCHAAGEGHGLVRCERVEFGRAGGVGAAAQELELRVQVLLLAGADEQVEQGGIVDLGDVRERFRFEILRHHLHHEANIRSAVGELTAVPTGYVHAAAGVHVDIGRARDGEEGFLMCVKGGTVGGRVMQEHRTAAPVASVGTVAEGFGPAGVMIKHAATARAAAVVLEGREDFVRKIFVP